MTLKVSFPNIFKQTQIMNINEQTRISDLNILILPLNIWIFH